MKLTSSNGVSYPLRFDEVDVTATHEAPVDLFPGIPEWGTWLEVGGLKQLLQERLKRITSCLGRELMDIQQGLLELGRLINADFAYCGKWIACNAATGGARFQILDQGQKTPFGIRNWVILNRPWFPREILKKTS